MDRVKLEGSRIMLRTAGGIWNGRVNLKERRVLLGTT